MRFGSGPQGTPHITVTTPEDFPRELWGPLMEVVSDAALAFEARHPVRTWELFCQDREG
jgi:hypothetical protein